MIDFLILGLRYGLIAAGAVGSFALCIAFFLPVIVLAYTFVGMILSFGGKKHE